MQSCYLCRYADQCFNVSVVCQFLTNIHVDFSFNKFLCYFSSDFGDWKATHFKIGVKHRQLVFKSRKTTNTHLGSRNSNANCNLRKRFVTIMYQFKYWELLNIIGLKCFHNAFQHRYCTRRRTFHQTMLSTAVLQT